MDRFCSKWDPHARVLAEMRLTHGFSNFLRSQRVSLTVEGFHLFGTTVDRPLTAAPAAELERRPNFQWMPWDGRLSVKL